mgnify:FL=1
MVSMFENSADERRIENSEMKILVVDDEPSIVQLLQLTLNALGFKNVEVANDAQEALAKVNNSEVPFDCFLLDIQMPQMNGLELCALLRVMPIYKRTPILMLTAMSDRDYIEQSFSAGANDYIMKPFEIENLVKRVEKATEIHRKIVSEDKVLQEDSDGLHLAFEDPVSFAGVIGFLERSAFKNYIDQMDRSKFRFGGFAVVRVSGANEYFELTAHKDFLKLLSEVNKTISVALQFERCHFTYAGSGCFFVMKLAVDKPGFHKEVQILVDTELSRSDLRYPTKEHIAVKVSVARLFRDSEGEFDTVDATVHRARERARLITNKIRNNTFDARSVQDIDHVFISRT